MERARESRPDHEAYLVVIREQSERFLEALVAVPLDSPVPTCEGWTAGDLLWHLGEVQHFWAHVAAGASGDDVVTPDRPEDEAALRRFVATAGTELLAALAARPADAPAWSWHADGGTLGWVARRMAHEALVHRADAELTAGLVVRPPAVEVAVDGVDEVLAVFVDGVPSWGTFAPDGVAVALRVTNASGAWRLDLGRFTGVGPDSGTAFDLDAAAVTRVPDDDPRPAELLVAGRAWDLDRWLWGRGSADVLEVDGDPAVLARLRRVLADATQ
ncbi:maleylpyruvate isomerase N-terminal domain-containing protein [Actinotalea fermentans]|uniref:Mycothiol-dependent maleylpyruvate isomerase metal-binding domain-containing protein n=1 Tax=Actinotalea fermentans TaxID=43671 RepID=A0A511YZN5_9CELL|nr:maleylpyruvate isomerase N-terminal domain-containing protein [Actinotalea fermentans]KGM16647.1 hypothetical protein N867_17725 [Actinotalea fermentans ATCC 43279 = JCM 9966 = DSM 3133]GEN80681.1 hypothetical protein AFE02nite_24150 [Actinotalea fermentans]